MVGAERHGQFSGGQPTCPRGFSHSSIHQHAVVQSHEISCSPVGRNFLFHDHILYPSSVEQTSDLVMVLRGGERSYRSVAPPWQQQQSAAEEVVNVPILLRNKIPSQ